MKTKEQFIKKLKGGSGCCLFLLKNDEKIFVRKMFISHVVSYLLGSKKCVFLNNEAQDYIDWGTFKEWQNVQKQYRTYFVDIDGILLKNRGRYGIKNWSNCNEIIEENMEIIKKLQNNNAQIVITTSRTKDYKEKIENILNENGIKPYAILTGLNHASRVLINDFAPTNPYPSAIAITIPRNSLLNEYIGEDL